MLPFLGGLAFRDRGAGSAPWNRTHVGSVKVAPAAHVLHGLSETCSEGSLAAAIFIEGWDGGGQYWEGRDDVVRHIAAIQLVSIGLGQGP